MMLRIERLHAPAVWTLPVYERYTNALLSMFINTHTAVTTSASSSPVCSNHILVVLQNILNNIGISTNSSTPSVMSDDEISKILSHKYHLVGNNAHWMFDCTYDEAKTEIDKRITEAIAIIQLWCSKEDDYHIFQKPYQNLLTHVLSYSPMNKKNRWLAGYSILPHISISLVSQYVLMSTIWDNHQLQKDIVTAWYNLADVYGNTNLIKALFKGEIFDKLKNTCNREEDVLKKIVMINNHQEEEKLFPVTDCISYTSQQHLIHLISCNIIESYPFRDDQNSGLTEKGWWYIPARYA